MSGVAIFWITFTVWSVAGFFLMLPIANSNLYDKLNGRTVFILSLLLGPAVSFINALIYTLEWLDKMKNTQKFQQIFFKPEHIKFETKQVERNITLDD